MTGGRKLLIDTNVVIGLEDWKELEPAFARLLTLCSRHGHRLYVHEAALDDLARDSDLARRRITLSKLEKFERLSGVISPPESELVVAFGRIANDNDRVDVSLLQALKVGAVDFLVTEDQGIHARARRVAPEFADRAMTVAEAVGWLIAHFEPKSVHLPLIEEVPAHAIDMRDEFFQSLKEDYPGFETWWTEKCIPSHRACWQLTINGELAGLVVRKEETHAEALTQNVGPKILKLCTFKVKPRFRGEKLGELLLKQALWFAQRNSYDLVYLTTFPQQQTLITVIEYFGFQRSGSNENGEGVYEKPLSRAAVGTDPTDSLFDVARIHYPRFHVGPPASSFCVPIRGEFHDLLFPELVDTRQGDLFEGLGLGSPLTRAPGNTIRKVYVCRAGTNRLRPGDVLYFYRSKDESGLAQHITTVGVAERMTQVTSLEQLIHVTAKRSAYSSAQLASYFDGDNRSVKVIDFLLMGHLSQPPSLDSLINDRVFRGPPQSIQLIPVQVAGPLRARI